MLLDEKKSCSQVYNILQMAHHLEFSENSDDPPLYRGRDRMPADQGSDEKIIIKRYIAPGVDLFIFEKEVTGVFLLKLLQKISIFMKGKTFVVPYFTPLPERYEGYPELQEGGYWLKSNQRLVIIQVTPEGARAFQ